MRKLKKVLLFGLTFAMSATLFAACGDKGGDGGDDLGGGNIQGETLADAEAWAQALGDTAAATNATVQISLKDEQYVGDFFMKDQAVVTAKIADGKVYVYEKTDASWYYEEDGVVERDEEHDEDQTYIAMVDGVATTYFKELENDWQVYPYSEDYMGAFSATVGFVLDGYAEINLDFVNAAYQGFVYENGMYVYTMTDEGDVAKLELKFSDGRLVWGKMTESGTYTNEGQNITDVCEIAFMITYGNTTIGALPDLNAGGSDIEEVVLPKGEQVNAESWNAAIEATMAADNYKAEVGMDGLDETGENLLTRGYGIIAIADNKGYTEMIQEMPGYGSFRMYSYCGNVDGKNYVWESYDGENWSMDEEGDAITIDGAWMVAELLPEDLAFENWTYDETMGGYSYKWNATLTITVGIIDGKIGFLHTVSANAEYQTAPIMIEKYLFSYGNATVGQLPPVQNAGGNNENVSGGTADSNGTTNVEGDTENN